MRTMIALAMLPAATIWVATPSSAPPIVAKAVTLEGVREQRQDENTFNRRWSPAAELPPTVVKEVHHLVLVGGEEVVDAVPVAATAPQPALPRHRLRSRAAAGHPVRPPLELCARHNMRRVMVSKYRWRCRR